MEACWEGGSPQSLGEAPGAGVLSSSRGEKGCCHRESWRGVTAGWSHCPVAEAYWCVGWGLCWRGWTPGRCECRECSGHAAAGTRHWERAAYMWYIYSWKAHPCRLQNTNKRNSIIQPRPSHSYYTTTQTSKRQQQNKTQIPFLEILYTVHSIVAFLIKIYLLCVKLSWLKGSEMW